GNRSACIRNHARARVAVVGGPYSSVGIGSGCHRKVHAAAGKSCAGKNLSARTQLRQTAEPAVHRSGTLFVRYPDVAAIVESQPITFVEPTAGEAGSGR